MKRKGCIVGMIGAMTLLLSFSGFSQEEVEEVKIKKIDVVKLKKKLNINRSIEGNKKEPQIVKREIQRRPVTRLKVEKAVFLEKRQHLSKPVEQKK